MSLKGISDRGRAILSYLKAGVTEGLSKNKIIDTLRSAGVKTYGRGLMLKDIGILQGAEESFKTLKYIRRDYVISERHYQMSSKVMTTKYKTVIKVDGTSKATGDYVTRYITVSHDSLLTRRELEEDAIIALERAESPTRYDSIMPVEAYLSA